MKRSEQPTPSASDASGADPHEELAAVYQMLEAEREVYRTLFEFIPDGYLVTSNTFVIEAANSAAAALLGTPQTALRGTLFTQFVTNESRVALEERVAALQASDQTQRCELWLQPQDSPPFPAKLTLAATKDAAGRLVQLRCLLCDISEQKQTEDALRRSQAQLASIIASASDAIITINKQQEVILFNTAAEKMFGYRADEVVGQSIECLMPIRFRTGHREHIRVFGQTNVSIRTMGGTVDTVGIRATGEEFPIEASISQTDIGEGKLYTVIIRDVTERLRAETTLRESRERLRVVLENMPVLLVAADSEQQFIAWNRECERVTGYSREEIIRNPSALELLLPNPQYREQVLTAWAKLGGEYRDFEVTFTHKNGSPRILSWSNISPTFPVPGWSSWAVGVDITERKYFEARTVLLQKLAADLAQAGAPEQVAEVIVGKALPTLGGHLGVVVLLSDDGQAIQILNTSGLPDTLLNHFRQTPLDFPSPLTDAIRTRQPVWITSQDEYLQRYPNLGEILTENTQSQATVCLPLTVNEHPIGGIGLSFPYPRLFDAEDRAFLLTLASYCAQALKRTLLQKQAQELAAAQERERIARELHDAVSQTLFAASVITESLFQPDKLAPEKTQHLLTELHHLTKGALAELRTLLLELRPTALQAVHLRDLLQGFVNGLHSHKRITFSVTTEGDCEPPLDVKLALYRITQEALNNVIKHSRASKATVTLKSREERVELTITDNGRGFDPKSVSATSMGLSIMQERVKGIGASLTIDTDAERGTRIHVVWRTAQS